MEWVESKRGKRKLSYEEYLYTWGGKGRVGNVMGGNLTRGEEAGGGGKSGGKAPGGGGGGTA